MAFEQSKQDTLARKDKSDEQQVDKKIRSLCKKINNNKNYYTLSSCAGRVILVKNKKEKSRGAFIFKSHNTISYKEIKKALSSIKYNSLVYFKQEAAILHVSCKDLDSAQSLLNKAIYSGFKHSGIISTNNKIVLELLSTERIELPVMNKGKLLVSDKYLHLLVSESNRKLERTWKKIEALEKTL
jgi:tRNA wybutosine-synthesizing protein 3